MPDVLPVSLPVFLPGFVAENLADFVGGFLPSTFRILGTSSGKAPRLPEK
ncbi:hypothetical protein [Parafrankia sp. BMG5.11]|nr:hypothetical protein [Parafrankia sp. BMG5.11]